jgi:hypothetical protein
MVLDLYMNAICAQPLPPAITSLNFYFESSVKNACGV